MDQREKDLKKYIAPGWASYIAVGLFAALILVALIRGTLFKSDSIPILFVFGILAVVCSLLPILKIQRAKKAIQREFSENRGDTLLEDFSKATGYCHDAIRVGEAYLFGRKTAQIMRYEDLKQVYQYIHKTNFVEDARKLRAVTQEGKTVDLCNLKTGNKDTQDRANVIACILNANPNVKIGYR